MAPWGHQPAEVVAGDVRVLHPCVAAADCHVAVQLAVVLPQAPHVGAGCGVPDPMVLGEGGLRSTLGQHKPREDGGRYISTMQSTLGQL